MNYFEEYIKHFKNVNQYTWLNAIFNINGKVPVVNRLLAIIVLLSLLILIFTSLVGINNTFTASLSSLTIMYSLLTFVAPQISMITGERIE